MLNPDINLSGKTAIITGASRGIGEAAAKRLAHAGANVVLVARTQSALESLAAEIGEKALAVAADMTNWDAVNAAVQAAYDQFGSVDILVNNAGVIDPVARLEDADPEAWSGVVDINLKGPFYAIRAALPLMKTSSDSSGVSGVVINVSSGAAYNALEGWSHYCATKAGLLSLTRCVQKECGDEGIRCVGISPGTVATNMQKVIASSGVNPVSKLDWSQHISPEIVGDAITWLCTDAARAYDGTDFSLKTEEERAELGWIKE